MDLNSRFEKIIEYSMLSASEFADELGVNRPNISHIISRRNKPSLDLIIKVKNRFPEINWEWIMEGKGEMIMNHSPTPQAIESKINLEEIPNFSVPDLFSISDENFEKETANSNSPELNIPAPNEDEVKIDNSQRLENKEISPELHLTENQNNKIKKIVFFYENGKFEIFEP